jgi:REP element-mobilizing transposase RayT
MARPLRIEIENGLYHVTSRGWQRRAIVRDEADRQSWWELLDRVAVHCGWRVFAWVLMTNHWHLFLRTPQPNLSAGMHDLNSGYATRFNRRHKRVGSLYQGRFKAILVEGQTHAAALSRYVHRNPVRAGIVARPQDYAWSSYRDYLSSKRRPEWLDCQTVLAEIGRDPRSALRAYRRFVEKGAGEPSPLKSVVGGMLLGRSAWIDRMRKQLAQQPPRREVPAQHLLAWRPSVEMILELVSQTYEVEPSAVVEKRRHGNDARLAALCLCRRLTDERVSDLTARFGGVSAAAITKAVARGENRRATDRRWKRLLDKLEARLRISEAPVGSGRLEKRPTSRQKLKVKT